MPVPSQTYTNELARTAVRSGRLVFWQRAPWSQTLGIDLLQQPNVKRPNSLQSSYLSPKNLRQDVFDRAVALIVEHSGS